MLTCTKFSVIFSVKAPSSKAILKHVRLNVETLHTEAVFLVMWDSPTSEL